MATYTLLAMAVSTAGAVADFRSKQAQAQQLEAQAKQTELQGRVNAVAYKRQGNEVLRRMNQVLASNVARGAARGLAPFASAGVIEMTNMYNRRLGVSEFQIARDNASMAKEMAKYQAGQQLTAAKTIKRSAPFQMMGDIATGFMTASQIGGADLSTTFADAVNPKRISNYGIK